MARALRSQRRGREFDSHHLHRSTDLTLRLTRALKRESGD